MKIENDICVLTLDTVLEMERRGWACEVYKNAADELNAQIAKLKGENEELRRGLRESEENVEYWRKHYDQAVRKYAEAVADENNQ